MQPRPQRLGHDLERRRSALPSQRIAIEVDAEPHVLRPTLSASEPGMCHMPVGLPLPAAEDYYHLLDRDGPIVPAGPAGDDEVGALVAQIVE